MSYERPRIKASLPKEQTTTLLSEYLQHYTALASSDISALNRKLPNETSPTCWIRLGSFS
jgi:hypothetical protein